MPRASSRIVELKISGMSCASCVTSIDKAVKRLEGVRSVLVNLGNETARVEYDPVQMSLPEIEKVITDAGYEVIHDRVAVKIGGMTCAMCVQTIENALKNTEGIISASVNLGAEKAYITYNPGIATVSQMKTAIEEAGYTYLGVVGEKTEDVTYSSISLAIYLPGLLDRLGEKGRKELQKAVQAYRKDIKDIV